MNDLEKYFLENPGRRINKWRHYFEIYDRHFSRFRGGDVHVVEFGVNQGGSLQMWKHYFGPDSRIFGVDINPHCKKLEEDRIVIFTGDQEDRSFLRSLAERVPRMDILIDDGGHTMKQQICTFEELFPHIAENGIYLCEDLHTSYWPSRGGGYKKRSTFVEYSKNFIDSLHAWHAPQRSGLKATEFTQTAHSVHYYDSVLVIEKRRIEKPTKLQTGKSEIPKYRSQNQMSRLKSAVKKKIDRLKGCFAGTKYSD